MTSKAKAARMRRLKVATETIEDELNRLPPPDARDFEARELIEAHHTVIRHLKWRWANLDGGKDTPACPSDAPESPQSDERGRK